MKPLTQHERGIFLRLLADTDAIWLPHRWRGMTDARAAAAIAERRRAFRRSGIPLAIGGADAARRAGNRDVRSLVERGLVRMVGSGKSRGLRMTTDGDNIARSMVPDRRVDEAWWALERVYAVEQQFGGKSNAGYMLEFDILVPDLDPQEPLNGEARVLLDFEDECLALLAAGYLECSSDTQRRLGYRTTTAGREALAQGNPGPPDYIPAYSTTVSEEFIELWERAIAARDSWAPTTPNQVWIPLSAGAWPRKPEALVDG